MCTLTTVLKGNNIHFSVKIKFARQCHSFILKTKSLMINNYNRGQKSLGHLCNVTDYLCFRTEV